MFDHVENIFTDFVFENITKKFYKLFNIHCTFFRILVELGIFPKRVFSKNIKISKKYQ